MGTRYDAMDYHAEMLPRADSEKPKQQKVIDEKAQAEIEICLNCTRKKCDGAGGLCMKKQEKKKRKFKRWTDEEIDYLVKNIEVMKIEDVAIALSRSVSAVRYQYNKLTKGVTK